jgi:hypothetical protein
LVAAFLYAAPRFASLAAEPGAFSGKVAETMNAGGYTYVLVDTGTNKVWAAANQFAVKPNDTVMVPASMPMNDFHSKSLNRDFSVIYFASSMVVNGAAADAAKLPPGHPAIGAAAADLPAGQPALPGQASPPKPDFTGIKPVKGGQTVAGIYAASAKLAGQSVTLRGRVVKYNANILGKNWVHIQDGTGTPGNNDLLVTTTNPAKLGDTVLVTGQVATNQDFGSGYKYTVLVETAKVTVE